MSIVSVNILAKGTNGPKWDAEGTRTYSVMFEVITDNDADTGPFVLLASGIPRPWVSFHPHDAYARCTSVGPPEQDEDSATYWRVPCEYSTKVPQLAQGKADGTHETSPSHSENPLEWRPEIELSTIMEKRHRYKSLQGFVIANKAGTPYEMSVMEIPCLCIDVERNLATFDYTLLNDCVGGVNVSDFLGSEARRVKCLHLTAKPDREKEVSFWKIKGRFVVGNDELLMDPAISPDGWWYDFKLNAGYDQLVGGVLKPIFLPSGQRPARPQLLDNNGAWAPNGPALYLGFRVLRDAPFNALGLFD